LSQIGRSVFLRPSRPNPSSHATARPLASKNERSGWLAREQFPHRFSGSFPCLFFHRATAVVRREEGRRRAAYSAVLAPLGLGRLPWTAARDCENVTWGPNPQRNFQRGVRDETRTRTARGGGSGRRRGADRLPRRRSPSSGIG
jgi:hypothetical protein